MKPTGYAPNGASCGTCQQNEAVFTVDCQDGCGCVYYICPSCLRKANKGEYKVAMDRAEIEFPQE